LKKFSPPLLLGIYCTVVGLWSLVGAMDFWTWVFEISVGVVGVLILILTYRKFRFSNFTYFFLALHFTVLALGAHYTYASMPLFDWLKEMLGLSRNHFDRVGHFFQGLVPALVTYEILVRLVRIPRGKILNFLVVCVCLTISAFWELIEMWIVQIFYPQAGGSWLGWQGDNWDAQMDMEMALLGALTAIFFLRRWQEKSLKKGGM
jgi:putative membrane protein